MQTTEAEFIYQYPPLLQGKLLKRYKRFFAEIELENGEIITAHCPNTGPMTGVCKIGSKVAVSRSNNPKRKLAYTWETILVEDSEPTWVGINTNLPNKIVKAALERKIFPELVDRYQQVRTEVSYGKDNSSRIDFLLSGEGQVSIYLEVKNTTLTEGKLALFPDTETTRGQKHLRELTALMPEYRAIMLYFINRSDCDRFCAAQQFDPIYAELLKQAVKQGVEVLPYRFSVSLQGVKFLGLAEFIEPFL
jgi:sugar fermentation stimulation protein A